MRAKLSLLAGLLFCFCLLVPGCFNAPAGGLVSVPSDLGQTCRTHCSRLGLRMSAVVIILNSGGCVCEPRGSSSSRRVGSAAVAGGAMIHAIRAAQQQRNK